MKCCILGREFRIPSWVARGRSHQAIEPEEPGAVLRQPFVSVSDDVAFLT